MKLGMRIQVAYYALQPADQLKHIQIRDTILIVMSEKKDVVLTSRNEFLAKLVNGSVRI